MDGVILPGAWLASTVLWLTGLWLTHNWNGSWASR